jgi:ribosomal protein S12 methylthiotransferase accessory factor
MHGIGGVYEMYRSGLIERDDEVALLFDPNRLVPLTVPLVNVRFAVERLVFSGTISVEDGRRLLAIAESPHFKERTYPRTLRELGVAADGQRMTEWLALFQAHDVKRADAARVLEHVAEIAAAAVTPVGHSAGQPAAASSAQSPTTSTGTSGARDIFI